MNLYKKLSQSSGTSYNIPKNLSLTIKTCCKLTDLIKEWLTLYRNQIFTKCITTEPHNKKANLAVLTYKILFKSLQVSASIPLTIGKIHSKVLNNFQNDRKPQTIYGALIQRKK